MEDGDVPGHDLRLVAPNRFVLQWVRERYLRRLEDMAKQFFTEPVQISINLPEAPEGMEIVGCDVIIRIRPKKG